MGTLLYIESSPRKQRSASIEVSKVFIEEYKKSHPADEVVILDLWNMDLPPFDKDVIDSKYAVMEGKSFTQEQKTAWKAVENLIAEFKSADQYLISIPMWNFSIPYKLKHYIDLIVQPGYTFAYSKESGYKGLVTNKKIVLICARGGAYGADAEIDLQVHYMKVILQFIGFEDIQTILIEPTGAGPILKDTAIQQAKEIATRIAINL